MARTPSTMLALGTSAPDFSLPEPKTGDNVSLADFAGQPLLLVFACNHCPFVLHIIEQFAAVAATYQAKGIASVMINANDVANFPDDSPAKMVELAAQYNFSFPYLYDETQQVAQAYEAACTPDLYLFDAEHKLVYRGQFDDARPGNNAAVTGADLIAACDALLQQQTVPEPQKPSLGCNIKWKAGNEPAYF
ncbi:MAG: thioredoxin family protein [Gammaproteobacteria bacterium]|nr:thioredoxin family protein [Gammaproteobacteria bacterium]